MIKNKCAKCRKTSKKSYIFDRHHVLNKKGLRTGKVIILCAICHRHEHYGSEKKLQKTFKITVKFCAFCRGRFRDGSMAEIKKKKYLICTPCYMKREKHIHDNGGRSFEEIMNTGMELHELSDEWNKNNFIGGKDSKW